MSDFTALLNEAGQQGRDANDLAFHITYRELRGLAARRLRRERPAHTLTPTALVSETYLKLVEQTRISWLGRAHFFRVAALAMRRLLINHARDRQTLKRGGHLADVPFIEEYHYIGDHPAERVLVLDAALTELEQLDERQAQVVQLRFFTGLTEEEVAEVLDVSRSTVQRDWTSARAWLYQRIEEIEAR